MSAKQTENVIVIDLREDGYVAIYSGPHAAEIRELFGTDCLPLPWTSYAHPVEVLADQVKRNPGVAVRLSETLRTEVLNANA